MIQVKNVTKKFGDFTAIQNINLDIQAGTIYGLVGYNGAGKTTLLKTIADVYRPESGEVWLLGEKVYDNAKVKKSLFYVPDDIYFQPNATMLKMAKFYKGFYPKFDFALFQNMANAFLLDMKGRLNAFSKGMQRQAEVALAFAARPKVLLLDESFDGLDPQRRNIVKQMIREYVIQEGAAVIISSHNLHELGTVCDHIGLINGKTLTYDQKVADLLTTGSRFRVIFENEVTREALLPIKAHNFFIDGKLVVFTANEPRNEVETKLNELQALSIEVFPLTVEDVFLSEMEDRTYDYTTLFRQN